MAITFCHQGGTTKKQNYYRILQRAKANIKVSVKRENLKMNLAYQYAAYHDPPAANRVTCPSATFFPIFKFFFLISNLF